VKTALPLIESYKHVMVLAVVLCLLLTLVGLRVPPSLSHDAGWGMLEWRAIAAGGPLNSIVSADPADISRDRATRVTWWSPGQYLVPGLLTLMGFRIGTALTITVGASLLCCLIGWIYVAKQFAISPGKTAILILFIATFRYTTFSFVTYSGGEILLQGLTPWLILAGHRLPLLRGFEAAGLAVLIIWAAFFAKLTGLIVASAALLTGSVVALMRLKRITSGMLGGAAGAFLAVGGLYIGWFSRGSTPASGTTWSFRAAEALFAFGSPWGAGVSWLDMVMSLFFNPRHPILSGRTLTPDTSTIVWFLLPPIFLFAPIILWGWRHRDEDENLGALMKTTICFYLICASVIAVIFLHGGDVSVEERHLRAAGTLIFLCVLAVLGRLPGFSIGRWTATAFCGLMALFGIVTFAYHARSVKPAEVDRYSWTYQSASNESAIEAARTAYTMEGRRALFVLPSPDVACALPPSARVLSNHIEFETETAIRERRYRGRVPGRLYVIVPTAEAQSVKGALLLKEFTDYPLDKWEKQSFGSSTMFVQQGTQD
jgi:hypothetical protein